MTESETTPSHGSGITTAFLDSLLQEARVKFKVPAIAAAVMNADSIVAQSVKGVRAVGDPATASLDDYFHIGSCAKSVLAVMAAKAVASELVTFETKFFTLFPELKLRAERAYLDITLEDLLRCRAGIRPYTDLNKDPLPVYPSSISSQRLEFVNRLVEQPTVVSPRDGTFPYLYSNASYTMAAVMLERVSGLTYEQLVDQVLRDDLGLAPHVGWPCAHSDDQPLGHVITNGNVTAQRPDSLTKIPYLLTPAGDLSLTPKDFARYTQWHLRGLRGAEHYLSSEAMQIIHFGHTGFSLGVENGSLGSQRYASMDGNTGTFFSRFAIAPDADFALTVMMNANAEKATEWLTQRILKKHFNWWWKFWL